MTAAAKGSDAMHDPIGTAAVGARSRPAGATGPRRAGTAFLGGLWAARAVRGWLALILLSGALALPALPVHADATDDLFGWAVPGTASEVKAALSAGADPGARSARASEMARQAEEAAERATAAAQDAGDAAAWEVAADAWHSAADGWRAAEAVAQSWRRAGHPDAGAPPAPQESLL